MARDQIVVEAWVTVPVDKAWTAYTAPAQVTHRSRTGHARVTQWNFASDDWHCPHARADLTVGGTFCARMEAKDGSFGFDFEGTYTKIIERERIEYAFGDRAATVEFLPSGDKVLVRVSSEPETDNPVDLQRSGWQAILDNYARHASRA